MAPNGPEGKHDLIGVPTRELRIVCDLIKHVIERGLTIQEDGMRGILLFKDRCLDALEADGADELQVIGTAAENGQGEASE